MKSEKHPPERTQTESRLTKNEKNVIQWAFNLTSSIVAGDYHLPSPMNVALNKLQDAAWDLAKERGYSPEDCCSKDFKSTIDEYWRSAREKILSFKCR